MSWLLRLADRLGGRGRGLVHLRDMLSLIQASLAVAAVVLAQSASWWAVLVTVLLGAWAMVRPLPEQASKRALRLWTLGIVFALALSGVRAALLGTELLIVGVDFFLLMIVQRLFNRQRAREHMQLLMLGAVLMVIAAVIDAELHYPVLLALYLPAATFALLVNHLVSEGERLGRRVSYEVDRYGTRQLPRLGRAALQVALISALAGVLTFLLFPRFGVGVFLRGNLYGRESVGFSENVRLGGFGTIKTDATVVMHLVPLDEREHGARPTWHIRGSAFDNYEDGSWGRSSAADKGELHQRRGYDVLADDGTLRAEITGMPYRFAGVLGESVTPTPVPGFAASTETARMLVTMEDIGTDLLFAAGQPLAYSLAPRGAIERRNRVGADLDDQVRVLDRQPGPIQYEAVGRTGAPTRKELAAVGEPEVPESLAAYLQLDEDLRPELRALAEEITAGARTRVEKVEAVEAYLLDNYSYSLDQPRSDRVSAGEIDPIEGFLFDTKAGHCEYFASAMALLLREVGVPTRNVNGFYGAHYNELGEFYAVRQADAHSWVEVHFGPLGWVTFDPTPPAGRTAGDDASWFPGIAELADALRDAYLEYVIDYDLGDQLEALERLGVERQGYSLRVDWRMFAPWLAGALGLLVAGLGVRRLLRRRRTSVAAEIRIYRRLLATMARRGRARREHESPSAWARRLAGEGAPEAEALAAFAQAYERARFGAGAVQSAELARLGDLATRVRDARR